VWSQYDEEAQNLPAGWSDKSAHSPQYIRPIYVARIYCIFSEGDAIFASSVTAGPNEREMHSPVSRTRPTFKQLTNVPIC
jgi:hypothetical protein